MSDPLAEADSAIERGDFAAARWAAREVLTSNPDADVAARAERLLNKIGPDRRVAVAGAICALAALAIFLYYTVGS